ncbi:MAG: metalloregulator ArsR/SmtB family transcription factor [Aquisalimonadaceae bacterium]
MIAPEQLFRALSDSTRLRCLLLLLEQEQLCVCEFVHALDLSQPLISRHLGQLRDLGIVQDGRHRQWVHYRLNPDLPAWARAVLDAASNAQALDDVRRRLAEMADRPSLTCN